MTALEMSIGASGSAENASRFDTSQPTRVKADSNGFSLRGETLTSLSDTELGGKFYNWTCPSGETYVCSVFTEKDEPIVAAFTKAFVIGVARSGGEAEPVCVIESEEFDAPRGKKLRDQVRLKGCNEWHVHFEANDNKLIPLISSLAR
jgi:hypothetical protein